MFLANNRSLRIFLDHKFQWYLYLHDHWFSVAPTDWNGLQIDTGYFTGITYSYQSFHLLKSPFATNCKYYMSDTEYYSRKDCIRKCKLKHSTEECGVIADEVEVYKDEHSIRFAADQNESICAESLSLDRICLEECPHLDCIKTIYKTTQLGKLDANDPTIKDMMGKMCVLFIMPREPETTFFHKPRIETVEFICYLASTVSLWFGVSMLSALSWLDAFFTKTKNINFIKNTNNNIRRNKVILNILKLY